MLNDENVVVDLPKLVLASGSPRRAEILNSVGWDFEKAIPDVDESIVPGESPEDYVQRLAVEKAQAVSSSYRDRLVLAADTTVVIEGQIIGKPVDLADARRMIAMLAGNWHAVLTGVSVSRNGSTNVGMQSTRVKFASMSDAEIDFLVEQGDPLDKAGGYAVQAQAALFIEGIEGDYWNVVGLPISLVYRLVADVNK
ncbi:MAG: Maf family protein [bacterium]|nr:Maf family protein [bacterium]